MNSQKFKNIQNDKFAQFIGLKLIDVKEGYAAVEMDVTEDHLNGVNMVQGGAIFTLADYAFAAASNSKGFVTVGINSSISFIKSPKGKRLTAKAVEISAGRKISHYNIDVFDEDGQIIARVIAIGYVKR